MKETSRQPQNIDLETSALFTDGEISTTERSGLIAFTCGCCCLGGPKVHSFFRGCLASAYIARHVTASGVKLTASVGVLLREKGDPTREHIQT